MSETTDTSAPSSARGRKDGIEGMLLPQLKQLAGGLGIKTTGMRKGAVIDAIKAHQQQGGPSRGSQEKAPDKAQDKAPDKAPDRAPEKATERTQQQPERQQPPASREPRAEPRQDGAPDAGAAAGDAGQGGSRRTRNRDDQAQPERQQDGRQQEGRQRGDRQQNKQQGEKQNDRQQQDKQQNNDRNQARQNDRQNERRNGQDDRQNERRNGQDDRQNDRRNNQDDRRSNQQDDRNDEGQDDDEGGSRRNRRRRGRDRQGAAAPVASSRGHRNEPDLQILEDDVLTPCAGILDLMDNYAFVRTSGYLPGVDDVYVSMSMVRRYGLRRGDAVTGQVRQPREGERKEKFNPLVRLDAVNGADPETARSRVEFAKLTPLHPSERLRLETGPTDLVGRVIDLAAPIGKGQRGLVVSPPQAGTTMVLESLARSITTNNPECHLMVVLVDERPEEVTDFQRSVKGEVVGSTFDRPPGDHTIVAELAVERAKRLVELGHDVVLLLDGLTRLGRAYALATPATGRVLPGGVDVAALHPPKRFFGAARNIENGGSLTIVATALVESGSALDEAIFEDLRGTANTEVRLRRDLADERTVPAVDVLRSGTRREEQLVGAEELTAVAALRRELHGLDDRAAGEALHDRLRSTQTNLELLRQVQRTAAGSARHG